MMSWYDSVRVETPEHIDFDLEVAGLGNRFVAQLIDWLIKGLVIAGLLIVVGIFAAALNDGRSGSWLDSASNLFLAIMLLLMYAGFFIYDIYFEGYGNGQTPGKRIMGIRVVRDTGGPIDPASAAIRNLVGLADFLPIFYLLGSFVILLNRRSQRLGDMAAGTIVIRERREEAASERLEFRVKKVADPNVALLPVHLDRCGAADIHLLHSFFWRYSTLERKERRRLARNLCDIFLERTGYQPIEPIVGRVAVMEFLASLYRDLTARRQYR
jgi:uncharacterized RDD family membrane protein YckC